MHLFASPINAKYMEIQLPFKKYNYIFQQYIQLNLCL